MKLIWLFLTITLGFFGIPESFSEDPLSFPSCNVGVFVTDNVQCFIDSSPPCPDYAFEKNGLCVVEKISICDRGNVLADGHCFPNTANFRVDDPTFTKKNLLTDKPIRDPSPNDFRESGDSVGMIYAFSSMGLVGIVLGFFVVKKLKNKTDN